jgi:hypothetical protein
MAFLGFIAGLSGRWWLHFACALDQMLVARPTITTVFGGPTARGIAITSRLIAVVDQFVMRFASWTERNQQVVVEWVNRFKQAGSNPSATIATPYVIVRWPWTSVHFVPFS